MANASQLFKDDEQERLGNGYVPDENGSQAKNTKDNGQEDGNDSNDSPAKDIASQEKSQADNRGGRSDDGKSVGAAGLASAEAMGAGLSSFNPILGSLKGGKILSALWGSNKRKRNTIGGSIVGLIVGGGFFGMSILSGPFEFIHIAQLLTHNHFSHQNDAGDNRTGKLWRYMRSGGSLGETRLSYIESKFIKDPTIAKLKEIGLELNIDSKTGINKGIVIDTASEKSPYHGKTLAEVNGSIKSEFGIKGDAVQIADGKFYVKDTTLNGGLASKFVAKANYSKIGTVTRGRVLGKFTFASWHPLKILDRKINKSISDRLSAWSKERETRLKTGVKGATIDATSAVQQEGDTSTNNLTETPVPGDVSTPTATEANSRLGSLTSSTGFKAAGGIAAVVGTVCVAKTIDDHVPEIRYIQVISPLIRLGMDAITVGNQIMNNKDVDVNELGVLSKQFNSVDASGNLSNWSNSASIKAGIGQSGGVDMGASVKDTISQDRISWLGWTQTGPIKTLCSKTGQAITTGVSVVVGIFSGGVVSTVAGIVASAKLGPVVVGQISKLIAGEAVNVVASGAEWGNNIDYGARLAANSTALQFGGVALNDKQVAVLNIQSGIEDKSSFESLNFMARMFNLKDYHSFASKALDSIVNVKQNVASIFRSGFMKVGQDILALPSRLLTSVVHAAPQPYQYPFPEYGFSQEDLNNPLVQDPYANAETVAKYLDANVADVAQQKKDNGTVSPNNDYVAKALACFAVNIVKGDQGWDVVPADQGPSNATNFNPYDTALYSKLDCSGSGDQKWLQIRFYILDTGVVEGLGCYSGDSQSCSNDGFNSGI